MTSSAGNSPPEGLFFRGVGVTLAEFSPNQKWWERHEKAEGYLATLIDVFRRNRLKPVSRPVALKSFVSILRRRRRRCRVYSIVPLFFSSVLLRVSLRFLSSRLVSCRPVSRRVAKRSNDDRPCSVLSRIERASCRVMSARAIDRPIGRSNQRIAEPTEGPTNETRYVQASSQQRANERRPARERAKGRLVVSFSFARSRGVRYRLGEPIPFDGQV